MAAKTRKIPETSPLAPIERAAGAYAETQAALAAKVAEVEAEVAAVHGRHAGDIHLLAVMEAAAKNDLVAVIDRNRSLFDKPKSRVLYGVKVGLRKGQDLLDLGDEARLIERIRDLLPDQAGRLVKESAAVVRAALKTLDRDDLRRLGVNYVAGADEPFATVEASDAAKAAAAILDGLEA